MILSRPNLVLITLDAFGFRLLSDNLDSLPTFKKLTDHGVVFRNAFATGPETPFSFPGIIAGAYASSCGVGISEHLKTIDQVTAESGYHTAFLGEAQGFLTPFFGYGRHISYSRNLLELSPAPADKKLEGVFMKKAEPKGAKGRWNPLLNYVRRKSNSKLGGILATTSRTLKFIQLYTMSNPANYRFKTRLHERFMVELEEFFRRIFTPPQFVWIHSMVTHEPYLPYVNTRFSESRINYLNYRGLANLARGCMKDLKSLYIDSMRTTDEFIARVIVALEAAGQLDSSIIILTADHGEEFMEEGFSGHGYLSSSDTLLNVPLIFYAPRMLKEKMVDAAVSTLDILPTVCDMLSVEKPSSARGTSLWSILVNDQNATELEGKLRSRTMFSEGWLREDVLDKSTGDKSAERVFVVRMDRYSLRLMQKRRDGDTYQEEYVLRDWIKNQNLDIKEHHAEFDRLRNLMREHLDRSTRETVENVAAFTPDEEEELRRRLGDLGYM